MTRILYRWIFLLIFLMAYILPSERTLAVQPAVRAIQSSQVTAYDLIAAMNTLRVSYGLPALIEDPIVNAVAQSTAEIMAANNMSWHIGDVRGRIAAAGYGGGATVWATENFAVGMSLGIDEIMVMWSDASHMIPAVNPAYCHVGAGVAKAANGRTYYVLQAAYTSANACGEYESVVDPEAPPGSPGEAPRPIVPQIIVPVKIATPDEDGRVFHVVEPGQSFWAIAVAYKITIKDLEIWNNLSRDYKLQVGQRLFIPGSNTEGYATPTPVGMVQLSPPDQDGKIVHIVEAYQTLSTIAQAYKVTVNKILTLNGLQLDWPLQIGQKLLIDPGYVTPSPTPRPLTPIERLTPESDGRYYHTVSSGETLSWIASYYGIPMSALIAWNGLNKSSIIVPGQKLVLQVTPPATDTPTSGSATSTSTATPSPPSPTPTLTTTKVAANLSVTVESGTAERGNSFIWIVPVGLVSGGLFLVVLFSRKKQ